MQLTYYFYCFHFAGLWFVVVLANCRPVPLAVCPSNDYNKIEEWVGLKKKRGIELRSLMHGVVYIHTLALAFALDTHLMPPAKTALLPPHSAKYTNTRAHTRTKSINICQCVHTRPNTHAHSLRIIRNFFYSPIILFSCSTLWSSSFSLLSWLL